MNMHQTNVATLDVHKREPLGRRGSTHPTRAIVDALSGVFADTLDVAQFSRHARWNLTGPRTAILGNVFSGISRDLDKRAHLLASRIAALGGTVHGTVDAIADNSQIDPLERQPRDEAEWILAASYRLRLLSASYHDAIRDCERLGDTVTVHQLNDGAAIVEEQLCVVDRHTSPNECNSA
ncbi:MAG: hypothetical protein KDJ37_05565 [Hyphomicrobiaceae bacterium]|nr:hypothetical protein [Hyphomicrobiaceae bacterium]